jgi:Anthrone oxygenase
MLPINKRILEPARDKTSTETRSLLERWGRLHAVRTIVSLAASGLFVVASTYEIHDHRLPSDRRVETHLLSSLSWARFRSRVTRPDLALIEFRHAVGMTLQVVATRKSRQYAYVVTYFK